MHKIRFSLRVFWMFLSIICMVLGAAAWYWHGFNEEEATIAWLEGQGWKVETSPALPPWLATRVPAFAQRHCRRAIGVDTFGLELSNNDVQRILRLKHLRDLRMAWRSSQEFTYPKEGDSGISFDWKTPSDEAYLGLGELKHLTSLRMTGAQVGPVFCKEVGKLPALRLLELGETPVQDADLAEIGKVTTLETLDLFLTPITDAGTQHLTPLVHLQYLNLYQTKVGNDCFDDLSQLVMLRDLDLSQTPLTGEGIEKLAALTHLERLMLGGTQMNNEAFYRLPALPALKTLDVGSTKVTHEIEPTLPRFPALMEFSGLRGSFFNDIQRQRPGFRLF